jgi:hypothetical protein
MTAVAAMHEDVHERAGKQWQPNKDTEDGARCSVNKSAPPMIRNPISTSPARDDRKLC